MACIGGRWLGSAARRGCARPPRSRGRGGGAAPPWRLAVARQNSVSTQGRASFPNDPSAVSKRWSWHTMLPLCSDGCPHRRRPPLPNRKTRQNAPRGPPLQVKPFPIFMRNHRHRANMYIPLYLIQHRHVTHRKTEKYTHEKACRSQGQGTATPNWVRLLLQNRGLPARVDPRAKSAA